MLFLSSTPGHASLMNLAERLLQDSQYKDGTCVGLVRMAFSEDDMAFPKTQSLMAGKATSKLRIAKLLLDRNLLDEAEALLESLDDQVYVTRARFDWQILLCLRVLIRLGQTGRALNILSSTALDHRIDPSTRAEITLRIAEEFLNRNHLAQARDLINKLDFVHVQNKMHLAQVYGKLGYFEQATEMIDEAYATDASLQDGYARLGWIRVVSKYRDLEKAFRLMAKDMCNNRMSVQWKKRFVLLMALLGRFDDACRFVERAYTEDVNLCDAYGFIGWGSFLLTHDNERFREWFERDCRLNRFAVQGRIFKANYLAAAALTSDAVGEAEKVCRENSSITDIFAGIGWHYFRSGDATTCCALMNRDWIEGKMSAHWLMNYAAALSVADRCSEAQRILENKLTANQSEERVVIGFPAFPDAVMSWTRFKALLYKKGTY